MKPAKPPKLDYATLDLLQEGIWVADSTDRLVFINTAMGRIAGVDANLLTSRELHSFPEEFLKHFLVHFNMAKETLQPCEYECPVVISSGITTWQGGWLTPLIEKGRYAGMICTVRDIAERKDAEEFREVFRRAIYDNPIGMILSRADDGRIIEVNDAYCRMVGYRQDELIGRSTTELNLWVDPADRSAMQEDLRRDGIISGREVAYLTRSGEVRYLRATVQLTEYHGVRCLFSSATDITEIRHTQDRLAASEAKYRSLFESMDEGFCIIEVLFDQQDRPVDFRFLEVNPSFERQTGLEKVAGRTILQLAPDNDPFWVETYGRIALTGEPQRIEHQSFGRWHDVYAWRYGRPVDRQVALLFNDVSGRKSLQQHIEDELRYRSIIEDQTEVISRFLPDGTFLFVNEVYCRLFGKTAEELIGKQWHPVVHPDDLLSARV
jgi:PAS domain S-box-containing protein